MYLFGIVTNWKNTKTQNLNIQAVTIQGGGCDENIGENHWVEHLKTTMIPNDVHVESNP
jgi:hypothetical protein